MEIAFKITRKLTTSYRQNTDFKTTKFTCPLVLGNLIISQLFPIAANIYKKSRENKDP